MATETRKFCDHCGGGKLVATFTFRTETYTDASGSTDDWFVNIDLCAQCSSKALGLASERVTHQGATEIVRAMGKGKLDVNHRGGK